jgi:hypothetical protein
MTNDDTELSTAGNVLSWVVTVLGLALIAVIVLGPVCLILWFWAGSLAAWLPIGVIVLLGGLAAGGPPRSGPRTFISRAGQKPSPPLEAQPTVKPTVKAPTLPVQSVDSNVAVWRPFEVAQL